MTLDFPDNSVLLHDAERGSWLRFCNPEAVLVARSPAEVLPVLEAIEARVATGGYGVGWVAYEAAPGFDALAVRPDPGSFPLVWFGHFSTAEAIAWTPRSSQAIGFDWSPSVSDGAYRAAIRRISDYIAAGETYQVNYSLRLRAQLAVEPFALFANMVAAQGAGYSAYVQTPEWAICSSSPELFWRRQGTAIASRPMKGTSARGLWSDADREQARALQRSLKNRAENVMVVDMVRNDLNRIGSDVRVQSLFDLEQYPTLWQLTSTVTCTSTASVAEVFGATFPPASIVGAPKARTMEIIAELEDSPRRIYTGSIGFFTRDRVQFNVAIRTVTVDRQTQAAEYGVGGGIVWDSTDRAELDECRTKAQVLARSVPEFELLETLLWTPEGGYFLRDRHLRRLSDSADYFAFTCDETAIARELDRLSADFPPAPRKVRLLVAKSGAIRVESAAIAPTNAAIGVGLARNPVDETDPFLYHKTTHRTVYETALRARGRCDDVLLWNRRGELTEACWGNLVLELDGQLVTPPVRCGLLAGTFRDSLLERGTLRERVVTVPDLDRATQLFVINSVRQFQPATFQTAVPARSRP